MYKKKYSYYYNINNNYMYYYNYTQYIYIYISFGKYLILSKMLRKIIDIILNLKFIIKLSLACIIHTDFEGAPSKSVIKQH